MYLTKEADSEIHKNSESSGQSFMGPNVFLTADPVF